MRNRTIGTALTIAALAIAACNQAATTASTPPQTTAFPEDYGEFYARPEELASVPANAIAKSMRMNVTAMGLGLQVYDKNCASCHGEDLKGIPAQHTPDLTDANWRFAGDDLDSAGVNRFPSDVEWTVRYGIRSGHPNARGLEADMVALDDALDNLAAVDQRKSQVVELRFFGGLSIDETAEVLKVSPGTVMRDWTLAKAWLKRELMRYPSDAVRSTT